MATDDEHVFRELFNRCVKAAGVSEDDVMAPEEQARRVEQAFQDAARRRGEVKLEYDVLISRTREERAELEALLAPAEVAFGRVRAAEREVEKWRDAGGSDEVPFDQASAKDKLVSVTNATRRLALATAHSEAHGVVIGVRAILDRDPKAPLPTCVLCSCDIPWAELVTGQASGPRGVVLHDDERAHRRCFEDAKGRMA